MRNKKAFTLIELLVVVLIIGILAAVALPQYNKAVEKSKATQAWTLLKALSQAQQAYFIENGDYATKFDELDVNMTQWTGNTKWNSSEFATDTRSNEEWSLQLLKYETRTQIYMGRISGSYTGAGFVVRLNTSPDIICAERFNNGITYDKEEGSYCEKLFQGIPLPPAGTFRVYQMP